MPKGKKKGKGKKSGKKGSKKKGNKEKKQADAVTMNVTNSAMWEIRLHTLERERNEFRDKATQLLDENEQLATQIRRTERDTIDVVSYLKRSDQQKEAEIARLEESIRELKKQHRSEKEAAINELTKQIDQLQEQLYQKTNDNQVLQTELRQVKEFRRKRGQMQKELDEIRDTMQLAGKEHALAIQRLEEKFFEEKMKLQHEANSKIAELAERAHQEAIANLDQTTRDVFKENVRLQEALKHHVKESDQLKATNATLKEELTKLRTDFELSKMLVDEKIKENREQKAKIRAFEEKIASLEKSLSLVVKEFDVDREETHEKHSEELQSATNELERVRRMLLLQSKEMRKLRELARTILEQRTELEQFFLDSLELVKREIRENQRQYLRAAERAFNERMREAFAAEKREGAGAGEYPRIRTFAKGQPLGVDPSTNSVYQDLEAAEQLIGGSGKVDVSELTWEQREKVLRYLFARMNSHTAAANEALARIAMQPAGAAGDGGENAADVKLPVLPPIAASPTATAALEFASAAGGESASQSQPQIAENAAGGESAFVTQKLVDAV